MPGFLLRGMSQHKARALIKYGSTTSDASNLVNQAICSFSSLFSCLNLQLLRICQYCSESNCKGPPALFVKLAAFKTIASSIISK